LKFATWLTNIKPEIDSLCDPASRIMHKVPQAGVSLLQRAARSLRASLKEWSDTSVGMIWLPTELGECRDHQEQR
jgi:hypothetical protein